MAPPERTAGGSRGLASVALLLTWLVPGAGHVLLGRVVVGAVAFVVLEGLFVAGLALSDGRVFEFLDPELRGPLAVALTPEVGNLGGLLWQLDRYGYGLPKPLPYPPHALLGGILTALSGLGNAFLMAHAHLEARRPRPTSPGAGPHPVLLALLAWLVPGLGHAAQGRRLRGLVVLVVLGGLFAAGTLLSEGTNLSRERHFYYWSGQFLLGLPAILTELASGRPPVTHEMRHVDVGLLYACMAGLLNVLAILDVHGVAERRWLGLADDAARTPGRAPEAAA